MQKCRTCKTEKTEPSFRDGSRSCRSCQGAVNQARRATPAGRAARMIEFAKRRAKKKSLPIDIDRDWVLSKLETGACELSGIAFSWSGAFVPSIDRVDSSKGYLKSNCRVVVCYVNQAINSMGSATFEQVAIKYLQAKRPELFVQTRKTRLDLPSTSQYDMFVRSGVMEAIETIAGAGSRSRPRAPQTREQVAGRSQCRLPPRTSRPSRRQLSA